MCLLRFFDLRYVLSLRHDARQGVRATFRTMTCGGDGRAYRPHTPRRCSTGLAAGVALLGPVFVVNPTMGDLRRRACRRSCGLGGIRVPRRLHLPSSEIGAGYVSSGYRDAMGFLLIILILLVRPTGLFAQKERVG